MVTHVRPLDLHAAATAASVGHLRRQVRRWLVEALDDHDVVDDLVLAVSEALENAVDHAFVDTVRTGTVTVRGAREPHRLTLTVVDDGHWQPPPVGRTYRRRGLALIDSLTDDNTVATGEHGTTVTVIHHLTQR